MKMTIKWLRRLLKRDKATTRQLDLATTTVHYDVDRIMEDWHAKKRARNLVSNSATMARRNASGELKKDRGETNKYLAALSVSQPSFYLDQGETLRALYRIFSQRTVEQNGFDGRQILSPIRNTNFDPFRMFNPLSLLEREGYLANVAEFRSPTAHNEVVDNLFSLSKELVRDYELAQEAFKHLPIYVFDTFPNCMRTLGRWLLGIQPGSRTPVSINSFRSQGNLPELYIVNSHPSGNQRWIPLREGVERIVSDLERSKSLVEEILQPENAELFKMATYVRDE